MFILIVIGITVVGRFSCSRGYIFLRSRAGTDSGGGTYLAAAAVEDIKHS